MVKNESALRSAGTDSQGHGSSQIDGVNLFRESNNVKSSLAKKSKAELDRQYLINTFTRFKLQHYAQNKFGQTQILQNAIGLHSVLLLLLCVIRKVLAHIITAWLPALMLSFVRSVLRELWESGEGR